MMVSQVTTRDKVCDQINVLEVGEGVEHVDQEPVRSIWVRSRGYTYGCLSYERSLRSFITEFTDFLLTIRTLDISFIAYMDLNFFLSTFHTRPKPPLPTTQWNLKAVFVIATTQSLGVNLESR